VWSKDFTDVKIIAYKKTKVQNAPTIAQSASSHIQQRGWRGYIEGGLKGKSRMYVKKVSLVLEEENLGI